MPPTKMRFGMAVPVPNFAADGEKVIGVKERGISMADCNKKS
jgi:hypothetical protein